MIQYSVPRPASLRSKAGRKLWVRPASLVDMPALAAMIGELSPATIQLRYLTPRNLRGDAAQREAERLTRPDNSRIVLVAEASGEAGEIVAVAELAQDQREPEVAEGAVMVADAYQGQGIGRAVVEELARHAEAAEIRRVRATTSAYNAPVRRLIASFGRPYSASFAGAEVLYEVSL